MSLRISNKYFKEHFVELIRVNFFTLCLTVPLFLEPTAGRLHSRSTIFMTLEAPLELHHHQFISNFISHFHLNSFFFFLYSHNHHFSLDKRFFNARNFNAIVIRSPFSEFNFNLKKTLIVSMVTMQRGFKCSLRLLFFSLCLAILKSHC